MSVEEHLEKWRETLRNRVSNNQNGCGGRRRSVTDVLGGHLEKNGQWGVGAFGTDPNGLSSESHSEISDRTSVTHSSSMNPNRTCSVLDLHLSNPTT